MQNTGNIPSKDQNISLSPTPSSSSISITDEDSFGNPLPTEIIEILKSNKHLEKKAASSVRSRSQNTRNHSRASVPIQNLSQLLSANKPLKSMLSKIQDLQSDLDDVKLRLLKSEISLSETKSENIYLSQLISSLQIESSSKPRLKCSCTLS